MFELASAMVGQRRKMWLGVLGAVVILYMMSLMVSKLINTVLSEDFLYPRFAS